MGKYFADIHGTPASQMGNESCELSDTVEVAKLRNAETYDELLALGKALCYQLRYREAVEVYTKAISRSPEDIRAYRQRAARYITTLQPLAAIQDFLRCRSLGGDEVDISYRLGLCHYLAGNYAEAMKELEHCYPLCDDEMGIAVIFWHTLSAWRLQLPTKLLNAAYHPGMNVGHHTAYEFTMAVASGRCELVDAMKRLEAEPEDLEYSIMAYGVAAVLNHMDKKNEAKKLIRNLLERDGFWISYAYIAAWNDVNR